MKSSPNSVSTRSLLHFIFNQYCKSSWFYIQSLLNFFVKRIKTFIQPLKYLMTSSSQVTLRADTRSGKSRLCNVLPAASLLCLLFLILTLSSEYKEEVCMVHLAFLIKLSAVSLKIRIQSSASDSVRGFKKGILIILITTLLHRNHHFGESQTACRI